MDKLSVVPELSMLFYWYLLTWINRLKIMPVHLHRSHFNPHTANTLAKVRPPCTLLFPIAARWFSKFIVKGILLRMACIIIMEHGLIIAEIYLNVKVPHVVCINTENSAVSHCWYSQALFLPLAAICGLQWRSRIGIIGYTKIKLCSRFVSKIK